MSDKLPDYPDVVPCHKCYEFGNPECDHYDAQDVKRFAYDALRARLAEALAAADSMNTERLNVWKLLNQERDERMKAERERNALAAQVEGLRKDAERYRWLRENFCTIGWVHDQQRVEISFRFDAEGFVDFDSAIDDAAGRG